MRTLLLLLLVGCGQAAGDATAEVAAPASTARPLPGRLVAVGDLHGDLAATRRVLKLAGVIDDADRWAGGTTTLVQTGDVLDRGDDEVAIYQLLWRLQAEAAKAGGRVVLLCGNHEIMNVQGDLRYVTPGGFRAFGGPDPEAGQAARRVAFQPGGEWARHFADQPIMAIVGDSAFAHGGILPAHARYGLDRINQETAAWLRGAASALPAVMSTPDAPIWTRLYSMGAAPERCAVLAETLDLLGVRRLVVGHSVQAGGPTSDCDGRVWRIDVGLSAHYGGQPAAIEIQGDAVRVLQAPAGG
ncbi:MAG: metallophosphoesterase [Myxococcales bacterium]|nr:metallophosphoesterase [Myxococcales bacterium]MCB9549667.1 metallophosphoesterase [Myxococcales bacterium]